MNLEIKCNWGLRDTVNPLVGALGHHGDKALGKFTTFTLKLA